MNAFIVSAGNTHFSSLDGVLFNKDKTSLLEFPKGREGEYDIPDTVESIEFRAFANCSLSSVTIPDSVTHIEFVSFFACRNLTSVTIPSSVTYIGGNAFTYCPNLTSLYFMGELPTPASDLFYEAPVDFVIYYAEGTNADGSAFDGIPAAPFSPWGKYVPITSEQGIHAETGNWLGILEISLDPWIWCDAIPCWLTIPWETANTGHGWLSPPHPDTLLIIEAPGTDWGYSFALCKWLYLTGSGWIYML